jgi:radical SAM superfamily enzyme YgiQ (UPF0313 family)
MSSKLLLATCTLADKWLSTLDRDNGHYPLGIASLHAVAEAAGHSVETLYLVSEPAEYCVSAVLAAVERGNAQVLGLSIITDNRVASFRVIEAAHQRFPGLRIVLGGVHVSAMYEQLVTKYPFVVAVLGEGEVTLPDLLDAFETGRDLAEVQGIAVFRNGQVLKTAPRPLIEDLDALPIPRHDIFYSPNRRAAQLLTSRGCPFACSFCALDSVSRRKVRMRSPDSVVDEIEKILADHPQTGTIFIYDDQFFFDNKRVIAICDEIVRRNIKCDFLCQGRVRPLSREMVLALERAGFIHVTLGLESGSPAVLERCNKKITLADVERAVGLFADSPISIQILLIIGLPGENITSIIETTDFCRKLQLIKYHDYDVRIQDLYIYPGTEICNIAKNAGILRDDYWLGERECPRFEVELGHREYASFREIILTRLSAARILTPGGFAAQRDMIPLILNHLFTITKVALECQRNLQDLVSLALSRMVTDGHMSFSAARQFPDRTGFITARRKLGSDTDIVLDYEAATWPLALPNLISLAYRYRMTPITDLVAKAVTTFLEEAFAAGDTRVDALSPAPAQRLRY